LKQWKKSLEDLKKHHFSVSAYGAFLIALEGIFKARNQTFYLLDLFTFYIGILVAGLVLLLYIILYKQTKGKLLRPFMQRTDERITEWAKGTVFLIILGLYLPLTFLFSYRLTYIFHLKYLRTYLDLFASYMGTLIAGLMIILYKQAKGGVQHPFLLRTGERKTERAIGAVMLVLYGIYLIRAWSLYSRFVGFYYVEKKIINGGVFGPLIEEFIFRVLLPYGFLLAFARIPRFAKQEIRGLPLPLVASHVLSALLFASGHWHNLIFDFNRFVQLFTGGLVYSCVFLLLLAHSDSTTGYVGAVLAHGFVNLEVLPWIGL